MFFNMTPLHTSAKIYQNPIKTFNSSCLQTERHKFYQKQPLAVIIKQARAIALKLNSDRSHSSILNYLLFNAKTRKHMSHFLHCSDPTVEVGSLQC